MDASTLRFIMKLGAMLGKGPCSPVYRNIFTFCEFSDIQTNHVLNSGSIVQMWYTHRNTQIVGSVEGVVNYEPSPVKEEEEVQGRDQKFFVKGGVLGGRGSIACAVDFGQRENSCNDYCQWNDYVPIMSQLGPK